MATTVSSVTGVTSAPGAAGTAASARAVESRDPATGEVWRRYEPASSTEIESAITAARAAQPAWAARGVNERARVLEQFHALLFDRRQEVAELLTRENGKPAAEAMASEVSITLDYARFYAAESRRLLRSPWFRPTSLGMWRKQVRVAYEPLGVVAVISPWNYPFMLAAGVVIPALVAGNCVILKPSELTPGTGILLGELLHASGVPHDVMSVLVGNGATGAALVESAIDKVFFTGSVATGQKVALACARRLLPCSLELGGSDPAIVLEDADAKTAASGIAWGRFSNAGQTCVAPKRAIVVGREQYERFIAAMSDVVSSLRVGAGGDPTTEMGPLVRASQAAMLRDQLEDAITRGARIVAQGSAPARDGYFPPTVLADVTPEMRVMREETFGPLLPVICVANADEAVALANKSAYGLSASIWGKDKERTTALAERLEAGTIAINDAIITAGMCDVPHGGVKASGSGRSHGVEGLLECVRTRSIVRDRWHAWRQPWWFGYGPRQRERMDAFMRLAHGRSLANRAAALWRVIGLLFRPERPL